MLPGILRKDTGWDTGDTIAIYALDKNTVILHMYEKNHENLKVEKKQLACIFDQSE